MINTNYKVFVFDLDFTLWDAGGSWCDCTNPPYKKDSEGRVYDSYDRHIRLYDDVLNILASLKNQNYKIALASRTGAPDWANQLTRMLRVDSYIDYREIYPGSKITHLHRIMDVSGYKTDDLIFFDDERRNIHDANSMGIEAVYVPNGMNWQLLKSSLS